MKRASVVPIEDGCVRREDYESCFRSSANGQARLFHQKFIPPKDLPLVAAVLFLHGVHEHSARYAHVLEHLAKQGVVGFTYDQLSHGRSQCHSGRSKGTCEGFAAFVEEAVANARRIRGEHPELPLFVWGQSFGGLVTAHVALAAAAELFPASGKGGLILTSPAFGIDPRPLDPLLRMVGRLLNSVLPQAPLVDVVQPGDMSKDPQAVRDYANDPLNHMGKIRLRLGLSAERAIKQLDDSAPKVKPSLVVLIGSKDKCVSLKQVKRVFAKLGSTDKEMRILEGVYHTMLHEPEKQQVMDAMVAFIMKHV
jgi:acylglycerol lipase